MNSVGIDVSKGKSMIAVMLPFGEVVYALFEVSHSSSELSDLAKMLKSLDGRDPCGRGGYRNNTLRRANPDKKDTIKLANYGLCRWLNLRKFSPEAETRMLLKTCYWQCQQYSKVQTMLSNNLISLLDTVFPRVNRLFSSPARADGSEKWVDFVETFWHCECVCGLSKKAFEKKYQKWYLKHGYYFREAKAREIYTAACGCIGVMTKAKTTHLLITQAVSQLKATSTALAELKKEMLRLAELLPEFPVVQKMYGVGPTLVLQLMAEIGDLRRFCSKKSLAAFAGIDTPPNDSR